MTTLTEANVEDSALDWLKSLGWTIIHGPDIVPGTVTKERIDYGQVILEQRLRDALDRLNPSLPTDALDDALRKLTLPVGTTLKARNRAFHRMLVDGVTVEYRANDSSIRGMQAQVVNFDDVGANDWLAVNQFTVSENRHTRRPDIILFVNGLPLGVIEPLFTRAGEAVRESRTLAALRDALLPKLISGELRVHYTNKEIAQVS